MGAYVGLYIDYILKGVLAGQVTKRFVKNQLRCKNDQTGKSGCESSENMLHYKTEIVFIVYIPFPM